MGLGSFITDAGNHISDMGDFVGNKFLGGDQARAARGAAGVQQQAAGQANTQATGTFNQSAGYQKPFYDTGLQNFQNTSNKYQAGGFNPGAMGQYQGQGAQGFSQIGYTPGQFNPGDLTQDPGYQFRMNQGIKAMTNMANAQGVATGNMLTGIGDYAQGQASNEMNNAFNRWNDQQNRGMQNNQFQNQFGLQNNNSNRNFGYQNMYDTYNTGANAMNNQFNQGVQLGGYGQQAANNLGSLGQNYSQQFGGNLLGGANAQAAGMVGTANAQTAGINNLMKLGGQLGAAYMGGQ